MKRSFTKSSSTARLEIITTQEKIVGNTWTVEVWKRIEWKGGEYGYEDFWRGESWLGAVVNFIKAKREGYGCVTMHWR